jgi:solute carrier family 25 protein 39/40
MDQAMANGAGRSRGGAATLLLPMEAQAESVIGGFWNEVATVRRETGVRGLWKGVGTTL